MRIGYCSRKLQERRAQILLPAILLAPIFILVIYLLLETAKVSMAKVRHQFALDNAAYTQMSSLTTYLNVMAMINGPTPYRVMRYYGNSQDGSMTLEPRAGGKYENEKENLNLFEFFYQSGAFVTLEGDKDARTANYRPKPESVNWKAFYAMGEEITDIREQEEATADNGRQQVIVSRDDWEKENPTLPGNTPVRLISKHLVRNYHFPYQGFGTTVLVDYLKTYIYTSSIYKSQDMVYKDLTKNAIMFRETYFLNVDNCKMNDCARESAAKLRPFFSIATHPFEIEKIQVFFSSGGKEGRGGSSHGGEIDVTLNVPGDVLSGEKLFQFAYLDPSSIGRLRTLQRGVLLKQRFKLPRNRFNLNLEQKYKPYVRNKIIVSCLRNGNNCVWPNPLPKYNIVLRP